LRSLGIAPERKSNPLTARAVTQDPRFGAGRLDAKLLAGNGRIGELVAGGVGDEAFDAAAVGRLM
jgi:hypothetical protein